MRATLADNFSQMWRQVEDRKALNAAFAHDLRTPLTSISGNAGLLLNQAASLTPEGKRSFARTSMTILYGLFSW